MNVIGPRGRFWPFVLNQDSTTGAASPGTQTTTPADPATGSSSGSTTQGASPATDTKLADLAQKAAQDAGDQKTTEPAKDAAKDQGDKDQKDQADKDAEADPVPETYELTPPEGFDSIDKESFEQFEPMLRKYGIGQKGAQELTNMVGAYAQKLISQTIGEAQAAENQRVQGIETAMREALAKDGYQSFDPQNREHPAFQDAIKGALALTGGDKAEMARVLDALDQARVSAAVLPMLARVGRKAGSDSWLTGGPGGGKRDPAAVMYPNDVR